MIKKRYERINFDNDNLRKKDYLDNLIYAEDLERKIQDYYNSDNKKPIYIALTGVWGSGKTTVAKTAIKYLEDELFKDKIKVFTYDAWKYDGDSFRRTFTKTILDGTGLKETDKKYKAYLNKLYDDKNVEYSSILERMNQSKKVNTEFKIFEEKDGKRKMNGKVLSILIGFSVIIATIIASIILVNIYPEAKMAIIIGELMLLMVTVFGEFRLVDFIKANITYVSTRLFSPEQFFDVVNKILKEEVKEKHRLILIDNIDRCSDDDFKDTMASIKGFFDDEGKVVYLVPYDRKQFDEVFKNGYAEKIFDDFLDIKEKSVENVIIFFDKLLNEQKDYKSLFTNEAKDILSRSDCTTPRKIINIFNNFITEYNLFISRNELEDRLEEVQQEDLSYLMKYTILKLYYKDFFNLIHLNSENIKYLENLANKNYPYKEIIDTIKSVIDENTYDFLKNASISPSKYEYFYSSNSSNDFGISNEIKEIIIERKYDVLKEKIDREPILKDNLLKYLNQSLMFDKTNGLWTISISNKIEMLVFLLKNNTITVEEIDNNFDFILKDKNLFDVIFFKTRININDIVYFVNTFNIKPNTYKFKSKLLNGLLNKKFDKNLNEIEIASVVLNSIEIDENISEQKNYFVQHIDNLIGASNFKINPHFQLFSSKNSKHISITQFISVLNKTTENDKDVFNDLISCFDTLIKQNDDANLFNTFIQFINRISPYTNDMQVYSNVFKVLLNHKDSPNFASSVNSLRVNTVEEKIDNDFYNDVLSIVRIVNNTYLRNIILNMTKKENKSNFINNILSNEENNNINILAQEFISRQTDFKEFLNQYTQIFSKLGTTFKDWLSQYIYSNRKEHIVDFYNEVNNHEDKEYYVDYILSQTMSFQQKMDIISLYESNETRYVELVKPILQFNEMEIIINNTKKPNLRDVAVDRLNDLITSKNSIINDDVLILENILKNSNITSKNIKSILVILGVNKMQPENLKTIYDCLKPNATILKEYQTIEGVLLEHNLITKPNLFEIKKHKKTTKQK